MAHKKRRVERRTKQMNQMNEGQMRNRRAELLMQIGEYYAREIRSQRMQATPEIMPLLDEIAQMVICNYIFGNTLGIVASARNKGRKYLYL